MEKNENRGGKREGAGRKKLGDKGTINKSITLPIEIWEKLDEIAEQKQFKSGNLLAAEIIKKFIDLF